MRIRMESVASHHEPRSFGVPAPASAIVTVTTTYLHIPSRVHFRPVFIEAPDAQIIQAHNASAGFYRFLYGSVGRDYHWIDRFAWSDEQIETHLARPATTLLVRYGRGGAAGSVEIAGGCTG